VVAALAVQAVTLLLRTRLLPAPRSPTKAPGHEARRRSRHEIQIFAGKRRLVRRIGMRQKNRRRVANPGVQIPGSLPCCCRCGIRGAKPRLVRQRGMRQAAGQSLRQVSDCSHKGVHFRCSFPFIGVSPFYGIQAAHCNWSPGGSTAGPTVKPPVSSPGRCRESARFRSTEPIAGPALCRHIYVTQRSVHDG